MHTDFLVVALPMNFEFLELWRLALPADLSERDLKQFVRRHAAELEAAWRDLDPMAALASLRAALEAAAEHGAVIHCGKLTLGAHPDPDLHAAGEIAAIDWAQQGGVVVGQGAGASRFLLGSCGPVRALGALGRALLKLTPRAPLQGVLEQVASLAREAEQIDVAGGPADANLLLGLAMRAVALSRLGTAEPFAFVVADDIAHIKMSARDRAFVAPSKADGEDDGPSPAVLDELEQRRLQLGGVAVVTVEDLLRRDTIFLPDGTQGTVTDFICEPEGPDGGPRGVEALELKVDGRKLRHPAISSDAFVLAPSEEYPRRAFARDIRRAAKWRGMAIVVVHQPAAVADLLGSEWRHIYPGEEPERVTVACLPRKLTVSTIDKLLAGDGQAVWWTTGDHWRAFAETAAGEPWAERRARVLVVRSLGDWDRTIGLPVFELFDQWHRRKTAGPFVPPGAAPAHQARPGPAPLPPEQPPAPAPVPLPAHLAPLARELAAFGWEAREIEIRDTGFVNVVLFRVDGRWVHLRRDGQGRVTLERWQRRPERYRYRGVLHEGPADLFLDREAPPDLAAGLQTLSAYVAENPAKHLTPPSAMSLDHALAGLAHSPPLEAPPAASALASYRPYGVGEPAAYGISPVKHCVAAGVGGPCWGQVAFYERRDARLGRVAKPLCQGHLGGTYTPSVAAATKGLAPTKGTQPKTAQPRCYPTSVHVVKGCTDLGIRVRDVLQVAAVKELGREYSHAATLVLMHRGKRLNFDVTHPNRILDAEFNARRGSCSLRLAPYKARPAPAKVAPPATGAPVTVERFSNDGLTASVLRAASGGYHVTLRDDDSGQDVGPPDVGAGLERAAADAKARDLVGLEPKGAK